jgi:hypothetical protein
MPIMLDVVVGRPSMLALMRLMAADNLLDGLLDAVFRVLHRSADALCGVFCLRRK